jgi:hypothetical protein
MRPVGCQHACYWADRAERGHLQNVQADDGGKAVIKDRTALKEAIREWLAIREAQNKLRAMTGAAVEFIAFPPTEADQ